MVGECGGVLFEGVGFCHLDEFPGNGGLKIDLGTNGVFGESVTLDSNGDVVVVVFRNGTLLYLMYLLYAFYLRISTGLLTNILHFVLGLFLNHSVVCESLE